MKTRGGDIVGERASASTEFGDTTSGVDLDTRMYLRGGQQSGRTTTVLEETLAGEAVAQVLTLEDGTQWTARHIGSGGNLVDVELTSENAIEEVQVTWFEIDAICDLKQGGQIKASNKSVPFAEIERLVTKALDHKGSEKYAAHDRAKLLLALHSPLPVTSTIVETCRAVVGQIAHGYREVWLVDVTRAHRLTAKMPSISRKLR